MDIITKIAKGLANRYLIGNFDEHKELLNSVKDELYNVDNPIDKINFINIILDRNKSEYEKHKLVCKNPMTCPQNYAHENVTYFLSQEINRLGGNSNKDNFTEDEKLQAESKIDQILKDLNEVKFGQQIIYDDLKKELNELRDLYFLGKRKWYQMFTGKIIDMTMSGIVSETISKQIIDIIKKSPQSLGYTE